MAKRTYYTLVTRAGAGSPWAPQFGDYERATVEYERDDYIHGYAGYRRADTKVITTDHAQAAIMARVAQLNEGE